MKTYYNGPRQRMMYGGMSMGTTLGSTMGQKDQMKSNRMRTTMGNNPMMQPMKYGGKKQKKKQTLQKKSAYKRAERGRTIVSSVYVPEKQLYPSQCFKNVTVQVCPFLTGQAPFLNAYFHLKGM